MQPVSNEDNSPKTAKKKGHFQYIFKVIFSKPSTKSGILRVSQYNTKSKTGGIFIDYANTFLKVKQEVSGWPYWCVDETSKQKYLQQYYNKEVYS